MPEKRSQNDVISDLLGACGEAAELVGRGRSSYDNDVLLRRAAEAIIGRIGDAAGRLDPAFKAALADVPWKQIHDARIRVDHIYFRIEPRVLWTMLEESVPRLAATVSAASGIVVTELKPPGDTRWEP